MKTMKNGRVDGIKVLVIGGSGFVGSHLMRYFAASGTSSTGVDGLIKLDIRDSNQIRRVIGETNPELVINSSGLTNVDYCETHPEEALEINGTAVGNIADCAEENGSILPVMFNCILQTFLKVYFSLPSHIQKGLGCLNSIPDIVPRTVFHILYKFSWFIKEFQQEVDNRNIAYIVIATNQVGISGFSLIQDQ